MFELLYTSVSPKGLSESELLRILESSRSRNEKLDVTGMLVYHNREIMQILEGHKSVVQTLFSNIAEDQRHTSVSVFYEGEIEQRAFSQWSMAFTAVDKQALNGLVGDYEAFAQGHSPANLIENNPNLGKQMFLSLRDKL